LGAGLATAVAVSLLAGFAVLVLEGVDDEVKFGSIAGFVEEGFG
jgi:hypothetical protein